MLPFDSSSKVSVIVVLQDAENKKSEKKEVIGPPLQTASSSVRALIEEKIIQKRTTGKKKKAKRGGGVIAAYLLRRFPISRRYEINRSIARVARRQADEETIKREAARIPRGGDGNPQHLRGVIVPFRVPREHAMSRNRDGRGKRERKKKKELIRCSGDVESTERSANAIPL